MLQLITNSSANCGRYLPGPYALVLLALVVLVAGMALESKGPVQMIGYWGDGFWNLQRK